MKNIIAAILLISLALPSFAFDSAKESRAKTESIIKTASLQEVPMLRVAVVNEIQVSVANGLFYTVVRVTDFDSKTINTVKKELEHKGYKVQLSYSGEHNQYHDMVIAWN